MEKRSRTLSLRAVLIGLVSMLFLGLWVQFHEVLVPVPNSLVEHSPPAGAVGVFAIVLLLGAALSYLHRKLRLSKGELILIYAMLIISAPFMTQGMWHRFLGLVSVVPRDKTKFALVDSYSEKLWPHGPHLVDNRRFEKPLTPDFDVTPKDKSSVVDAPKTPAGAMKALELTGIGTSADDKNETKLRVRIPRIKDGKQVLIPGERYYMSGLFRLQGFASYSSLTVELITDTGDSMMITSLRENTKEVYSQPGAFKRTGEPFVTIPLSTKDYVDIRFSLRGPGKAAITDIVFFNNEAIGGMYKGKSEVTASNLAQLDENNRSNLLVRPDNLYSLSGIWYTLKGYIPYEMWAGPLAYWVSISLALFLGIFGMSVIFRRQWAENERFSFPLVAIPRLLITEEEKDGTPRYSVLRSPVFKIGAILGLIYCIFLGLAHYIPGMPNPVVSVNLANYFTSPAMKKFCSGFYSPNFEVMFLFVAIAFFIDLDMLLSIVLLFWVSKLPFYFGEVFGWKTIKGLPGLQESFPFAFEQHIGAFLSLSLVVLWTSRKHLLGVWRRIFGMPGGVDDSREAFSYRTSALLIVGAFVFFAVWGEMTGLGAGSSLLFFGFLMVCGLSASRIRTECGVPATYFTPYQPYLIFFLLGGLGVFGTPTLLLAYAAGGFMAVAQFLMFAPSQVEILHLTETEQANPKGIRWGLVMGALGGILIGGYVVMVWCYGTGGDNIPYMKGWAMGQEFYFRPLANAVRSMDAASLAAQQGTTATAEQAINYGPYVATGAGVIITLLLVFLRTYFVGFWLHPLGYVLANTYCIYMCWGSLLVAWLIKWLGLKIGGPRIIREQMNPFFAGLFVGLVGGMLLWDILGVVLYAQGMQDIYICLP